MPVIILAFFGYLALFGAGLVGKYLTGFDSGYCMSGIVASIFFIFFFASFISDLSHRKCRKQHVSPEQQ